MINDSFEEGFSEGEEWDRSYEKLKVKGQIVGNLIQHTSMTDEEIFNIVDLGEEKWSERIKYLRSKYEEGLRIGRERFKQYEEEINKIMEYEESLNDKARQNELREKIKLFDELESIANVAKVELEKVKVKGVSKSSRLRGIQENLEKEREINKKPIAIKGNRRFKNINLNEEQEIDYLHI